MKHIATMNRVPEFRRASAAAALTVTSLLLAGCGPAKSDKPAPAPTNQVRQAAPILSDGDAELLQTVDKGPMSDGDRAWRDVEKLLQAPTFPPEWQVNPPAPEEIAAFEKKNAELAAQAADKAKEFYTKFPNHEKAREAHDQEYNLINVAVQLGNTNRLDQLIALEQARLKDPALSEEDRLELLVQQFQRAMNQSPDKLAAALPGLEKSARSLHTDFPDRPEVSALLLQVAENWLSFNGTRQSRALAEEILRGNPDDELKEIANGLLKRLDRLGQTIALKFTAADGRAVDLEQMKGKVVLIDFWASWCDPCMAEMPRLREVYEKFHARGFEIVGVSFDHERSALEQAVAQEKIPWPQRFEEGDPEKKLGAEFGVTSIPAMWLLDKQGVLRELNVKDDLEQKVGKLLAEK